MSSKMENRAAVPKTLLFLTLLTVNILNGDCKASTSEDSSLCPAGDHVVYKDSCYYYRDESRTWWGAEEQCEALGGTLLIAEDASELRAILKDLKAKTSSKDSDGDTPFWIGLHGQHEDGQYYWADGTPLQAKWQGTVGRQDSAMERCVSVYGWGASKIDVLNCDSNTSFICEIRPGAVRWAGWSSWSECSVTCGSGIQFRTRQCLRPSSLASGSCQGDGNETKSCGSECKSAAEWGAWQEWGPCSVTCDVGTRSRQRVCLGKGCLGSSESVENCQQASCPVWEAWQAWGACSVTCGVGGQRTRSRQCSSNQKGACSGSAEETSSCDSPQPCPAWTGWEAWSECSVTCGSGGQRSRTRQCSSTDKKACTGSDTETEQCSSLPACATWEAWQAWSACSVTCGVGGERSRSRQCSSNKKDACSGSGEETATCDKQPACPDWMQWEAWGECSVTCGSGGQRSRTRLCSSSDKKACTGSDTDTQQCSGLPDCAAWEAWQAWSACSVTCGVGGERSRSRKCSSNKKDACSGNGEETAPCDNSPPCPEWMQWEPWSQCSVTCGSGGQRSRTRQCSSSDARACTGKDEETEKCTGLTDCVEAAQWGAWQAWSECSVTCGNGGQRSRSRTCSSSEKNACKGSDSEQEVCKSLPDCGAWATWEVWGECSVTCGNGGHRSRTRQCSSTDKNACKGNDEEKEPCKNLLDCEDRSNDNDKKHGEKKERLSDVTRDYVIDGYEIQRLYVSTSSICAVECMRTTGCRSFSYQAEDEGITDKGQGKSSRKAVKKLVTVREKGKLRMVEIEVEEKLCILYSVSGNEAGTQFKQMKGFRFYDMFL